MKILYVIDNIKKSSGVSSVIMNYFRKINKKNFSVDFLLMTKYDESYEQEIIDSGSKIYYLKTPLNISNYKKFRTEVNEFFATHEYDLVELHAPILSFIFMKIAKINNVKIRVIHTHSTMHSSNFLKNIVGKLLNLNIKKNANYYFSCSRKSGLYWFGEKTLRSNNYLTISNGIDKNKYLFDIEKRCLLRKKYDLEDNFVIGFVGRLSKEKNLFFLLKVMKKIVKKRTDIKLVIIGDGLMMDSLKKSSEDIRNNVVFLGHQNNVNELINMFDIFVLPSKREGLPMVVVEAQMCNLDCFVSKTVTEEVNVGKVKFLPLKVKVWQKQILNYQPFKKIVNRDEFDIDICVKKLENIYERILKENH